tara:strand:+ start:218 stop:436 length:219 start_codon:yes stop_codon:yes gene_type:complete
MTDQFYIVDYIPNRLVYVYETNKKEIKFLAFINGEGVKHSVNVKLKKDFKKPTKRFKAPEELQDIINLTLGQ